jgi:hypothetical protein
MRGADTVKMVAYSRYGGDRKESNEMGAKSRATLTPPLKSPSALISLRKIGIGKSSFASDRDPTQEVDSHK